MKGVRLLARSFSRLLWPLLSVPIYFKIAGIGALVAVLFSSVTLYQIRTSMVRILSQILEQRAFSTAISVSSRLERPVVTDDLFAVHQLLGRVIESSPDIRYIIVQDSDGRVVAHTFAKQVPPDLELAAPRNVPARGKLQVLASPEGLIFDATVPILGGIAGKLRLGFNDQMIVRELWAINRPVLWTMALCVIIGQGLAFVLTHILARPIHNLVRATNRIRMGDFDYNAEVCSGDEIGKLALAFNEMARALQKYRREIQEKEAARVSLIERIVLAQEEERMSIARELHDELGQSLLALLLAIQSAPAGNAFSAPLRQDLQLKIRELVDEVHRLAHGMRPSILDDYGLDSALRRYVEEVSERFRVPIDYQCISPSEGERLPGPIEVALYRIAQEAITNIVRHARASWASVVLLQQDRSVTLLIEDDGVGFDPTSVKANAPKGCLGLIGMKERVALLGGNLAVESVPGSGTTIQVRIPLNGEKICQLES